MDSCLRREGEGKGSWGDTTHTLALGGPGLDFLNDPLGGRYTSRRGLGREGRREGRRESGREGGRMLVGECAMTSG